MASQTRAQITTFTNPTPAAFDLFGYAVAAVGTDKVLIGAYWDDTGLNNAGAAYLFRTNGTLLTTFTNPAPAENDYFGRAVAAVGTDKVLIGASLDDAGATNAGAAYLFRTNGTLLTTFTNPAPAVSDFFGYAVAAVGTDKVLIGAYSDNIGATNAGAAYLFRTNGTLLTTFTNPTPATDDNFGFAVAAVGADKVLIGAYLDNTGATDAGAAYLFRTNGTLLTTFTNATPVFGDHFGYSVAAVGTDKVLIGAYNNDTGEDNTGAAYLFSTNGTLLTTFTNPTPENSDKFGIAVAGVGTDKVLIGAYLDNTGAANAGAAYLFSTNGTLLITFTSPTPANQDEFGIAVAAVDANHVLVGAYLDDTGVADAGAAYLFSLLVPPSISTQPQSQTVSAGSNASFAVVAASAAPLSYQWRFKATNIAGATASNYTRTNAQPVDAGPYTVVVTNSYGSVTSAVATLTVVSEGEIFPLLGTFSWKYLDDGNDQGTAWRGAGFDDSGWSNGITELGYGDGDEATVVGFGPDQTNKYITTYFRHAFNIANPAAISNLALQFKRDDGIIVYLNGTEIIRNNLPGGGVSNSTLATVFAPDDGNLIFTNSVSPALLVAGTNVIAAEVHQSSPTSSDISFALGLSTNVAYILPPTITTQPQSHAVNAGSNVTFTVAANGTEPLSYQWRFNATNIAGATASSYTRTNAQPAHAGPYTVVVTNSFGSVTSAVAALTVTLAQNFLIYDPSLGTLPQAQGFVWRDCDCSQQPATVSGGVLNQTPVQNGEWWDAFSSEAFDFSTGFTLEANLYVISSSYNPADGFGRRHAGYELWAVDDTGRYLGINITSSGLWLDTSGNGSAPPGGGTFFTPFVATNGFNNYRLVALGTNATLFINGSAFLSIPLGQVEQLGNANSVGFGNHTAYASNQTELAWFCAKPAAPLAIALGPQSQTVEAGADVSFSVVATGDGPFTYQWRFNGTNLPGQTSASLLLTNVQLTNAGPYCVVVVDAWNATDTNCATLTVLEPPGITTQPVSQTVASGSNVTFTVGATGSAPLLYQWRYNGANILGATNSTHTITNVQPTNGGVFSVLVANPVGVMVSVDATLKVLSPALAFADNFAARGTLNGFSGVGSGTNTTATREANEPLHDGKFGSRSVWLEWTAPGTGVATFNTRGSSFDTLLAIYTGTSFSNLIAQAGDDDSGGFFTSKAAVNVTNGTPYLIAIDGLGSASGDIVLSWNLDTLRPPIPVITQHPLDVTVTNGGSATFSITTASPNVTYQWYFNQSLVLTGATSATLVIPNVVRSNVGFYTVAVTGTNSQTVRSLAGSLEIGTEVATHTFDKLVDLFQAFQTNGGGNFAGSWKKGGGGTPASLSFPSVAAGSLGSQIINNFGATTDRGEPILTNVIGGNSRWYLLTAATNGTMVVDTAGSEINTQLKVYTGSNILSMALVAGDNHGSNSLVSFAAGAGTNYLIGVDGVTNNVGVVNINWRLGTPPAGGGPASSPVLSLGDSLVLQAGDAGAIPAPNYQWRQDGVNLVGFTNATCTLSNLQYNHGGVYSVVVSNFVGVVTNVIATVSVQSPLLLVLDASSGVPKSRLSATATQARVLQLSTNLTQWTPLYTNSDPSVPVVYLDPNSFSRSKGFYRLVPWP